MPGMELLVWQNPEAKAAGINPFDHGSAVHTDLWKTQGLKQALDHYGFDAAFGGARRDEEKSRAKERVFSFRGAGHRWDPKAQRPELWRLYNARHARGESIRVFPISNWTELDIWQYIHQEGIEIVDLYLAAPRPVVDYNGLMIMVDDDRFPLKNLTPTVKSVRFRTLGCYPLSGAVEIDRHHPAPGHSGNAADHHVRTPGPRHRPRPGRQHGEKEAGGVFLMTNSFAPDPLIAENIEAYLEAQQTKNLLRVITCGSVDDGKSTLIGRLLYDSKQIFDDQLSALEADSKRVGTQGQNIDFALLVDGLAAEREQGITIDVAYRFFATDRTKFIIADCPGHEQYTRNMVTGASTADAAIVLIDARKGVLTQTRRHSYLAKLIGIRHVVLAVNKMDLIGFDQAKFDAIVAEYRAFAAEIGLDDVAAIPISGLGGDNITESSANTPWYTGLPLLRWLENVEVAADADLARPFRLPVQWVNRPNLDFRGFAGTIASGRIAPGDGGAHPALGPHHHRCAHRHARWRQGRRRRRRSGHADPCR